MTDKLNKLAVEIISEVLPDLFDIKLCKDSNNYLYYFKDSTISKEAFKVSIMTEVLDDQSGKIIDVMCIDMVKKIMPSNVYDKMDLSLNFIKKDYGLALENRGQIRMNRNIFLSEQSCVALFKMGIDVCYFCPDKQNFIYYNRVEIMRCRTIKEIIDEDCA